MVQAAVRLARQQKQTMQRQAAYEERIRTQSQPPKTGEEMLSQIVRRGHELSQEEGWKRGFVIDKQNEEMYAMLSRYFTSDEHMERDFGLDPNKGLFIFGNIGCGKTVALRLFQRNPLQPYTLVSCQKVVKQYDQDGADVMDFYGNLKMNDYQIQNYGHKFLGYAFDDLGTELDGRHYGKTFNVLEAVIQARYDNSACRGPKTHLTSNATQAEIEQRYGRRVFDRMRQMFNIIEFSENAKSRRA